ncbi:sugar phosphate isomerase/epimerase family protein [Arsenicibacter rosenii]|uniref:Xylose isomerase n=1 Tax=Arsenicibacter rosenii TaxID=1750698 RepID=A0A1S2VJ45_9BACT|nr:TIM barrel protein [Arsenicibacter rosenii]OIN58420.1 xylose isomerase [Arsenicibacter rosenii]
MNRRTFLQRSALGAAAFSVPAWPMAGFANEVPMGVVVHSYGFRWNSRVSSRNYPGFTNAIDLLEHCHDIGAGGIQVVVKDWSTDFASKVRDRREKLGMYLEGSIGMPKKAEDVPAFEQDVQRAREAGVQVLRTVSLGGRRYETFKTLGEFRQFQQAGLAALQLAEPVLRKHKVKLAVENHKDWRAPELVAVLKQVSSEYIGTTIDFGNSIALLEDPMEVLQALAPYVMSTHIKDMAVEEYTDGFLLSEVPLGTGILDLPKMVAICKQHNPSVTFNLEMITRDPLEIPCLKEGYWATFADVPATELARTLHMVRTHKPKQALPRTTPLSPETRLATEEENIISCLTYSKNKLAMR